MLFLITHAAPVFLCSLRCPSDPLAMRLLAYAGVYSVHATRNQKTIINTSANVDGNERGRVCLFL
jgi:hypothetical protein